MKYFLLAVTIFALTTLSALSIGWYLQAGRVQAGVEQTMASIHPDVGSIKAEKIEVSGFPTRMAVTLTNPKMVLNNDVAISDFLRRLYAQTGNSAGVLAPPRFPKTTLEISLTGTVSAEINAISNRVHYRTQGPMRIALIKDGTSLPILLEPEGATTCEIGLQGTLKDMFSQGWDFAKLTDINQLADHFRTIRCDLPAMIATDESTSQLIFSQSSSALYFSHVTKGKFRSIEVTTDVKESEIYPAGDNIYRQFADVYSPVGTPATRYSPSLYGKQSFAFDMAANLPVSEKNIASDPFDLQIKKMTMSNDYYRIGGTATITSAPKDNAHQVSVKLSFTSDFTDKQPMFAKQVIDEMIDELSHSDKVGSNPELEAIFARYGTQKVADTAYTILPNVSSMGTLTQTIDAEFTGNPQNKEGSLTLKVLELSSRDYGITGNGSFALNKQSPLPVINANFTCKNCLGMITTAENYVNRAELALAELDPTLRGHIAIAPQHIEMVRRLLSSLGVKNAANPADLDFALKSEAGNVTINQKTLLEIMALLAPQPSSP